MEMINFTIFCDGGVSKYTNKEGYYGGIGSVILNEHNELETEISEHFEDTTNNQMELLAFINSIKYIKEHYVGIPEMNIHVISDSNYLITGCNEWINAWKANNWRTYSKQPVKNLTLWKEIDLIINEPDKMFMFEWVKAHQSNATTDAKGRWNNRADVLASMGKEKK